MFKRLLLTLVCTGSFCGSLYAAGQVTLTNNSGSMVNVAIQGADGKTIKSTTALGSNGIISGNGGSITIMTSREPGEGIDVVIPSDVKSYNLRITQGQGGLKYNLANPISVINPGICSKLNPDKTYTRNITDSRLGKDRGFRCS